MYTKEFWNALEELIRFIREQGRHIIISGASREVFRILKHGGIFLGGYDNGINYLLDDDEKKELNGNGT